MRTGTKGKVAKRSELKFIGSDKAKVIVSALRRLTK